MKKKTKEWVKNHLIDYLNKTEQTISSNSWSYKKGIGERPHYFKNHYDLDVEEYLTTKFHLQAEEEKSKEFFNYLFQNRHGNEELLLEFLKSKSPNNKTKIEKDGSVQVQDSSNEHYSYQTYMVELLTDKDMLFDYIGNLRFLAGEQNIAFNLIENFFDEKQKETLIEMYLNSSLMKTVEFERKLYLLLEKTNLLDKYKEYFPNLKEGKKDFSIDSYDNKQTHAFIVSFDNETLVKQIEGNRSLINISDSIKKITKLQKIEDLSIETINVIESKNKKTIMITGDNLNIDYIKVAITEYMKLALKDNSDNALLNRIVFAPSNFDEQSGSWGDDFREAFVEFKERIQKVYLKEKLEKSLIKEEIIKTKPKKI